MGSFMKDSKLSCKKIIEKAVTFFGSQGWGLDVKSQEEDCARFVGGGGYVLIECCKMDGSTEVNLETREWDYQVKKFMETL